MTKNEIMDKVSKTPVKDRPLICYNGTVQHMNDEQYIDYLENKNTQSYLTLNTTNSPEDRIRELEQKIETLESAYREGVNNA